MSVLDVEKSSKCSGLRLHQPFEKNRRHTPFSVETDRKEAQLKQVHGACRQSGTRPVINLEVIEPLACEKQPLLIVQNW